MPSSESAARSASPASDASPAAGEAGPVGFVGIGQMGRPMAENLLDAGYAVRVYNRTRSKAEPLLEQGAEWAETPAEACVEGGLVLTMVSDDEALRAVTLGEDGVCGALGEGGIHVAMSTIAPQTTRDLAALHDAEGETYLAAPVFGRPDAAEAATLSVCASGPTAAQERARPLFEAMGERIEDFGEEAEAANVVKLAGNFLIASAIEAMGEAFALVEKHGIGREQVAALLAETLFASPVYKGYGGRIARKEYTPAQFPLPLGRKDVTLAAEAAAEADVPMPLAHLVQDKLTALIAKGRGDLDWTGLAVEASEAAGLPGEEEKS